MRDMPGCQVGEKQLHPADFSHPDALTDLQWWGLAQTRTYGRSSLMYKIVHNLVLIEEIKYVKLQRNLINLHQVLANKKYCVMSFSTCTVKHWNSLPKTLLAADNLKPFKAWGCQH